MGAGDIDLSGLRIARETDCIRGVRVAHATPAPFMAREFGGVKW